MFVVENFPAVWIHQYGHCGETLYVIIYNSQSVILNWGRTEKAHVLIRIIIENLYILEVNQSACELTEHGK